MTKRKAGPQKAVLVRLDAELKEELDRQRIEYGIPTNFIVNAAVREWIEQSQANVNAGRRRVVEKLKAPERSRGPR